MTWTIEYGRGFAKPFSKLSHKNRERVLKFLDERVAMLDDPRTIGKALKGPELKNLWRYRVGDIRILCEIQDNRLVILVVEIGPRDSIYG